MADDMPNTPPGRSARREPSPPPPGLLATAELDYHAARDRLSVAVQGTRLVLHAGDSLVEAFAEAYYALSRTDPGVAAVIGAAAIVQLAACPSGSAATAQSSGRRSNPRS